MMGEPQPKSILGIKRKWVFDKILERLEGGGSVGNGFVIKTTMSFLASPRCSRNNVC